MTEQTVSCPKCGSANRPDARWCANCAQPLGQPAAETPAPSAPATPTPPAPVAPPPQPAPPAQSTPAAPAATAPRPPAAPPAPAARPAGSGTGPGSAADPRIWKIATVVLAITTILFAIMAFAPSASPIKPPAAARVQEQTEEDEAVEVASRFAENILTFTHQTIDGESDRILADASDGFASKTQPAFVVGGRAANFQQFRDQIKANQTVSTGDSVASAATTIDGDNATVFVIAFQRSRNATRPQRDSVKAFELALVDEGGDWKVNEIKTVGQ